MLYEVITPTAALGQLDLHQRRRIMVAGQPIQGAPQGLNRRGKALVGPGTVVLGKIPGGQYQIEGFVLLAYGRHHGSQAVGSTDAQQFALRIGKQVRVGDLQQANHICVGIESDCFQVGLLLSDS